ncbi:MAG: carboxypeptidase regulatory-like domain-containing protein [Saprospiraceae bacterium]|nr:carboxypeptidase regulatory-like domain-containing protein [Saprospiraceae bacterium]
MKLLSSGSFQRVWHLLVLMLSTQFLVSQSSSYCPVGVSVEPRLSQSTLRPGKMTQSNFSYYSKWVNPILAKEEDNQKTSIKLSSLKQGSHLHFSDFVANIPAGASIKGIEVFVKGQSTRPSSLSEMSVTLLANNQSVISQNKANSIPLQKPWSANADGSDKKWCYGGKTDTWGIDWNSDWMNAKDFTLEIQLRNASVQEVTAMIDHIDIVIHYVPLFSFCRDTCVVFFVDKFNRGKSYHWTVPENFAISSREDQNTINIMAKPHATFGTYTICAEVFDNFGNVLDQCCRDFNFTDCALNTIQGVFWEDANLNNRRDASDPLLSGVGVSLRSLQGQLVSQTTSDVTGKYSFNQVPPGQYYLVADKPSGKLFLQKDVTVNEQINSDITNVFSPGSTNAISLLNATVLSNVDFGFIPSVEIGDFVWHDINYNGIQEAGEPGLPQVGVQLLDVNQNVIQTTTTDNIGKYTFLDVVPGTYRVSFDIPADFFVTCQQNLPSTNSNISDTGLTPLYTFASGVKTDTVDAGFVHFATLSGKVFEDAKADGNLNETDTGLKDVRIVLSGSTFCGESVTDTILSAENGDYSFLSVKPGNYTIKFVFTDNYFASHKPDSTLFSNKMDTSFVISDIIVLSGNDLHTQHAGVYRFGSVSGTVWNDQNVDSFENPDESGLQGLIIKLEGQDVFGVNVFSETTTDSTGFYLFDVLTPGTYQILVEPVEGYGFSPEKSDQDTTRDNNSSNGLMAEVLVCSGQNVVEIDAAVYKFASVGDLIWDDINANGLLEPGEPGVFGILVDLTGTDVFGSAFGAQTSTDSEGFYSFDNLNPGNYVLSLSQTRDYLVGPLDQGNDDALDNDFTADFVTDSFELAAGQQEKHMDAGLFLPGVIRGLVWEDKNCDGIFGFIDESLANVQLVLNGTTNIGDQITLFTESDQNGTYIFEGLTPGNYQVSVVLPNLFQTQNPVRSGLLIESGLTINDLDFSLYQFASIGDFVWMDTNGNGIQDADEAGIHGLEVQLSGISGGQQINQVVLTNDGFYRFENLKPGEYNIQFPEIQDMVATLIRIGDPTLDSDMDDNNRIENIVVFSGQNVDDMDAGYTEISRGIIGDFVWEDLNANGIKDDNESGIGGIPVFLSGVTTGGQQVNYNATTIDEGIYFFTDLRAGNYTIRFELPQGWFFTKPNAGNGMNDSKVEQSTGLVPAFDLAAGEIKSDIDAGAFRTAGIGDFVWFDTNENGLQDAGESGQEGVTISLLELPSQTEIDQITTDATGFYTFENLVPGAYVLRAAIPDTTVLTLYNVFGESVNSDFFKTGDTLTTLPFILISGEQSLDTDLGLIVKRTELGGLVWRDSDADGISEPDEPIYTNVDVLLLNLSGDTIQQVKTDSTGRYFFENISADVYRIVFPIYDSLTFTRYRQGSNPEIDNDVQDLQGGTILVTIQDGEKLLDLNAGYIRKSSVGDFVWFDTNENGLQDAGENGLNGISVYVYNLSNQLVDSVITNIKTGTFISGYYQFDGLFPGDYYLTFGLPKNLLFTNHTTENLINSDVTGTFGAGTTDALVLDFQEDITDIDAGYIIDENALGEINGVVWQDANANEKREVTDILLEGVEVRLWTLDGQEAGLTFTDEFGRYSFEGLLFGSYYLSVPDVENRVFVLYSGQNPDVDSEITNEFGSGTSRVIALFPGDSLFNIDLGYAPKISLGDFVWEDLNNNGIQDAGEPGLANVKVSLLDKNGQIKAITMTDFSGNYGFDNLAAGNYGILFESLPGYIFAMSNVGPDNLNSKSDLQGRIANRDFINAGAYINLDAGMIKGGTIGSRIWLDLNGNGIFSDNEPGISEVMVELFTETGNFVASTKTGVLGGNSFVGSYKFENVRPGNYYVKFVISNDYLLSNANLGNEETDSDITNTFGRGTTEVFSILSGQQILYIDGGAYLPACIGDLVWDDVNKNGNQDEGEPGIAGVKVSLFLSNGQLVDSIRTDGDGKYKFNNLRSRLYYLHFGLKEGFEFTIPYNGNSSVTDSDVDNTGTTPLISLAHGSIFLDVDAGMFSSENRVVMGVIWDDINKDGLKTAEENVIPNIKVTLLDENENILGERMTNHIGMYTHVMSDTGMYYIKVETKPQYKITKRAIHAQLICNDINVDGKSDGIDENIASSMLYKNGGMYFNPTTYLTGIVWEDTNNDFELTSADELLDSTVVLLFNRQNIFVKSTLTDAMGRYTLDKLDPGQYYIKVPLLDGKTFILMNESMDSQIDNQRGEGTSRVIFVDVLNPGIQFNLGYRMMSSLLELPETNKETTPEKDFLVYPNPTMYDINVEVPSDIENAVFRIFDSQGREVKQGILQSGKQKILLTDVSQGMYILQILAGDKRINKRFYRIENY